MEKIKKEEKLYDPTTYIHFKELSEFIEIVLAWTIENHISNIPLTRQEICGVSVRERRKGIRWEIGKMRGFISALARERFFPPYLNYEERVTLKVLGFFLNVDHSTVINAINIHQVRIGMKPEMPLIKKSEEYLSKFEEARKLFIPNSKPLGEKKFRGKILTYSLETDEKDEGEFEFSIRDLLDIIVSIYGEFGVSMTRQEAGKRFIEIQSAIKNERKRKTKRTKKKSP